MTFHKCINAEMLRPQIFSSIQPKLELKQDLFFSRISESTIGYTFSLVWDLLLPLA